MRKFKSCAWYVVLRLLIVLKDLFFVLKAVSLLLFCWMYEEWDIDEITGDMDVVDRKWTRFGR